MWWWGWVGTDVSLGVNPRAGRGQWPRLVEVRWNGASLSHSLATFSQCPHCLLWSLSGQCPHCLLWSLSARVVTAVEEAPPWGCASLLSTSAAVSHKLLEGKLSRQPLAMTCALLPDACPLLESSLHQSVWDRSRLGNKQSPNLRGTKEKGIISQLCLSALLASGGSGPHQSASLQDTGQQRSCSWCCQLHDRGEELGLWFAGS